MAALPNPKQEKFCVVWHETGNKSEAYRQSHPGCKRWKPETITNKASALSKEDGVSARFKELQSEVIANHGITIENLLMELQEARLIALQAETPQSSAAVSATMAKAKLVGLDVTKIEVSAKEELTPWGAITASVDE